MASNIGLPAACGEYKLLLTAVNVTQCLMVNRGQKKLSTLIAKQQSPSVRLMNEMMKDHQLANFNF